MDFGIPRKYFRKAIETLRNQLPSEYQIRSIEDGVGIYGEIVKIEDVRTVIHEIGREDFQTGVFVDIFPLDCTNNNYSRFSRNRFIEYWVHAQQVVLSKHKFGGLSSKLCILASKVFGKYFFVRSMKYIVARRGDFVTNYSGIYGSRETVNLKIFEEAILYEFEDALLWCQPSS